MVYRGLGFTVGHLRETGINTAFGAVVTPRLKPSPSTHKQRTGRGSVSEEEEREGGRLTGREKPRRAGQGFILLSRQQVKLAVTRSG